MGLRRLARRVPVKSRVLLWLEARGKTQYWLATKVGIGPTMMSQILNGSRVPSLPVAKRLEDLTGIKATDFIPQEGRP